MTQTPNLLSIRHGKYSWYMDDRIEVVNSKDVRMRNGCVRWFNYIAKDAGTLLGMFGQFRLQTLKTKLITVSQAVICYLYSTTSTVCCNLTAAKTICTVHTCTVQFSRYVYVARRTYYGQRSWLLTDLRFGSHVRLSLYSSWRSLSRDSWQ